MRFFKNNKIITKMNIEILIVIVLFTYIIMMVTDWISITYYLQASDTAGFVDLVGSAYSTKSLISPAFNSFGSLLHLMTESVSSYQTDTLSSTWMNVDAIISHPYIIAYILSYIAHILKLDPVLFSSFIIAINIVGVTFVVYIYSRYKNISVFSSTQIAILTFISTPLLYSLVGQFYFDRLMPLPLFLLLIILYEVYENKKNLFLLMSVVVFTTILISERSLIMIAYALSYYLVLFLISKRFKEVALLSILLLATLGYFYIWSHFFQDSIYYSKINLMGMYNNLLLSFSVNGQLQMSLKLILTLLPFLILSLFNKKFFLIGIFAIIPNLLVTVGGAEKTGFTTHYHSAYIAFVIFAGVIGFFNLYQKNTSRIKYFLLSLFIIMLIAYELRLNGDHHNKIDFDGGRKNYYLTGLLSFKSDIKNSMQINKHYNLSLVKNIPLNSTITTQENLMPVLVATGHRLIDYFPIGIYDNDYLLVSYEVIGDEHLPILVSYVGREERIEISRFLDDIIARNYELVKDYKVESSTSYIKLLKRKK
jgi:hypothetical protein